MNSALKSGFILPCTKLYKLCNHIVLDSVYRDKLILAAYSDKPSKVTGCPTAHIELRLCRRHIVRYDLVSIKDLMCPTKIKAVVKSLLRFYEVNWSLFSKRNIKEGIKTQTPWPGKSEHGSFYRTSYDRCHYCFDLIDNQNSGIFMSVQYLKTWMRNYNHQRARYLFLEIEMLEDLFFNSPFMMPWNEPPYGYVRSSAPFVWVDMEKGTHVTQLN